MKLLKRANPPTSPINGRPSWVRLERDDHRLRLRFRWWSRTCLLPAVIGPALICGAAAMIQADGGLGSWLVAIVLAAAGLSVTLWAAVRLLNTTTLDVTKEQVRSAHAPIPVPGAVTIATPELLQLFQLSSSAGVRVVAVLKDGDRLRLTPLLLPEQAQAAAFIEHSIEKYLAIPDRPIVCPTCGYDIRITPKRCPECGTRFRKGRAIG